MVTRNGFHLFKGELQSWAIPRPPTQRIVSKIDALSGRKPYGTFHAQLDDTKASPKSFQMNEREKGEAEESEKDVDESVTSKTTSFQFNTASEDYSSIGDDYSTAGTNEYNSSDNTSCTNEVNNVDTFDTGIGRERKRSSVSVPGVSKSSSWPVRIS